MFILLGVWSSPREGVYPAVTYSSDSTILASNRHVTLHSEAYKAAQRQQSDSISLLLFFQTGEGRLNQYTLLKATVLVAHLITSILVANLPVHHS
jgi:hypothetical protein